MPVDLSEFAKLSKPKRPLCPVGVAFESLKPGEKDMLRAALAEDGRVITGTAIVTWMGRRGLAANQQAVTSHRRATCTCADD